MWKKLDNFGKKNINKVVGCILVVEVCKNRRDLVKVLVYIGVWLARRKIEWQM